MLSIFHPVCGLQTLPPFSLRQSSRDTLNATLSNARGWGVGRKLNSDFVDFSSNQVRAARKSEFNGRVPARRVEEKRIDVPADYIVVFT